MYSINVEKLEMFKIMRDNSVDAANKEISIVFIITHVFLKSNVGFL